MNNGLILQQVMILFLMIATGFIAKKSGVITHETGKGLSAVLLKITSPFLVIVSFQVPFSWEMLSKAGIVFLFGICTHLATVVIGGLLYRRYPEAARRVLVFTTVYSNCGFMGIPVLQSLYGSIGVFYASIYIAVFNLFVWTHGVLLFTGQGDKKTIQRTLTNPGILSVVIGMILFIFSIRLPVSVFKALDLVGSTTTPLAMLIIGSLLAEVRGSELLSDGSVYYASAVRLLILPVLALIALKLIGLHGTLLGSCILLVAMPIAANTALFTELYDGDSSLASRCVAVSTLLSMITLPLVIMLI